jgi:3-phytase
VRLYYVNGITRGLEQKASAPVFEGEQGDFAAPMGVAIYKEKNGAASVIVGRKNGPTEGYLFQYRIVPGPGLEFVRKFGKFSGAGEIEAIVVDDALGHVYYADEGAGIRKYHADFRVTGSDAELAFFGRTGYAGDREGLAIYTTGASTGFIVSTDQVEGGSRYLLYRREGGPGGPHDHSQVVFAFEGPADSTDGIEATSAALSEDFPLGILVAMNSGRRNFLLFPWPNLPLP